MENDLQSIYEAQLLGIGNAVVTESKDSKKPVAKKKDEEEDDVAEESVKKPKGKKKFMKKKKKSSKEEDGAICYDSVNRNSAFEKILREFADDADFGAQDSFGGEDDGTDFDFDDEQESYTLEELRSMTLGELANLLSGSGADDNFGDDFGDDDFDSGDQIPTEAYAFTGNGKEHGAQGTYDGKAKRQPKTTHVKDNGDVKLDDQDTGYDPEDTEGSEGSEHGAQGTYDGKAKRQGPTNLVQGNGNVNRNQKTGYGKPEGRNYF